MVTLLIAIVVLQFAGANLGAHQLHAGNSVEEAENHAHLQFRAPVTTLAQCIDCVCSSEQELGFIAEPTMAASSIDDSTRTSDHSHLVQTTEVQNFDLCLDCQCHGGHVALLSHVETQSLIAFETAYVPTNIAYFPPEQLPEYRPPIA